MKKPPIRAKAQKEGFTDQGLPTSNVLNDTVERVTPGKKKDVEGMTGKGRVKFTTMLRPDLKSKLLMSADKQRRTLADVLEEILLERYNTQ